MPSTRRAQDQHYSSWSSKGTCNGLQPFRCSKCLRWWSNFQTYRNHNKRTHKWRGKLRRGAKIKLTYDLIQSGFENQVSVNVQTKQTKTLVQEGNSWQIPRKQSTKNHDGTNQTPAQGKGLLQSQTCEKQTIAMSAHGVTNCAVDQGKEGSTTETPSIQSAAKLEVTKCAVDKGSEGPTSKTPTIQRAAKLLGVTNFAVDKVSEDPISKTPMKHSTAKVGVTNCAVDQGSEDSTTKTRKIQSAAKLGVTNRVVDQGSKGPTSKTPMIPNAAKLGVTSCVVDKGSEGSTMKTPTLQGAAKVDVTNHVVDQRKCHVPDAGRNRVNINQRTIKNCLAVPLNMAGRTTVVIECKTCICTFRVSRLKRHGCFVGDDISMDTLIECKVCKCKVVLQEVESHKCDSSNGTLNVESKSTPSHSNTAANIPARISCADEASVEDVHAVENSSLIGPGFTATPDHGKASTMACQYCELQFKTIDGLHKYNKTMHQTNVLLIPRNSNDSQADSRNEASTTFYRCTQCATMFSSGDELQNHNCTNTKATKKRKRYEPFVCVECEKLFPTREHLIFHQRLSRPCMITGRKNMPLKYQCTVCTQKFFTKTHLHEHRNVCTIFACQYCGYAFKSRHGLRFHAKILHSGETPYECMQCRIKFTTKEEFDQHRTSHKDQVMVDIKCKYCDDVFKSWREVTSHERKHRFECSQCERSDFRCPYTRDVHVKEVHMGGEVCACSKCGEKFLHESDLEAHSKAKLKCDRFKCKECNWVFKDKCFLDRHVQVKHNEAAERPYRCEKCNKRFILEKQLKKHLEQIHPDDTLTEKCHLCQEMFKSKRYLQRHLARKHTKETLKYKCPHCEQHVSSGHRLDRHIKMFHSGTYECTECGKSFQDRNDLNARKKKVHPDLKKKHPCSTCGKKYESASKLRIHERIHTGERPYLCLICGKGFTEESQLKSHNRTHEGKKSYLCSACGKGFVHLFSLKSHVKHNHKDIKVPNITGKTFHVKHNHKDIKVPNISGKSRQDSS